MANKHLKLEPHHIMDGVSWYEMNSGINVLVEHTTRGGETYLHTQVYLIPWKDIRAALGRKDLPKVEKVKK